VKKAMALSMALVDLSRGASSAAESTEDPVKKIPGV
jgi:hypothetical protein